jgi:hypothetical protein
VNKRVSTGRLGLVSIVALGAAIALAVFGGTGVAGGATKGKTADDGPAGQSAKVTVCHKTKVTIRIASEAVKAHTAHGDTLAACAQGGHANAKLKTKQAKKAEKAEKRKHPNGRGDDHDDDEDEKKS